MVVVVVVRGTLNTLLESNGGGEGSGRGTGLTSAMDSGLVQSRRVLGVAGA